MFYNIEQLHRITDLDIVKHNIVEIELFFGPTEFNRDGHLVEWSSQIRSLSWGGVATLRRPMTGANDDSRL
jgi:hypothetical protein